MAVAEPVETSLASDKAIRPFLAPSFDPADFLNATLPSWTPRQQQPSQSASPSTLTLAELNAQAQTLLSQLSAQLTRLSATLTKLTDDILRAGGRLAYEVEVLSGDTASLSDTLTDGLRNDIAKFIPPEQLHRRERNASLSSVKSGAAPPASTTASASASNAAAQISQLRTLALVRDRLESVVNVFGKALEWPMAPSEVSLKSSFISVSGPDSRDEDVASLEARGREHVERTRGEVGDLLAAGGAGGEEGLKAALDRVEQFRVLAEVWKGTSEEKARARFVEGLAKLVEERKKATPSTRDLGYRIRPDARPKDLSSPKR